MVILDPPEGVPREGVSAPVAWMGVQSHEIGNNEGIFGNVDILIVHPEILGLPPCILWDSRKWVVKTESLELYGCQPRVFT